MLRHVSERSADVDRLIARAAIQDVLARYARGIDRRDMELVRSCFHPGAVDDHGSYNGPIDGFVEHLATSLDRYAWIMHFLAPPLIELEGELAWTETYCQSLSRLAGEPPRDRIAWLRYCDRFERRDGEWRIAHRIVAWGPNRVQVVHEQEPMSDRHQRGARDRSDPAYRRTWELPALAPE
jgi:hypothetical protein